MPAHTLSSLQHRALDAALEHLAISAAENIPGVDFASITMFGPNDSLRTAARTDPLAGQLDGLQHELREGPCYSAVTDQRLVLVNDLAAADAFPRYAPRATALGVGAQAAIQLVDDGGERAGLNLYARTPDAFDRSTIQIAELFATQAAALLHYAEQVEHLGVALHTRTDIGTAVGILMERHRIDRNVAFSYLVRCSNRRNIKLRMLAQDVIAGTFREHAS